MSPVDFNGMHFKCLTPVVRMLDKPTINVTLAKNLYPQLKDKDKECRSVIGSCNGLLCLYYRSWDNHNQWWLRVWNPATRTISDKLGYCPDLGSSELSFGYDNLSNTYKVVGFPGSTTKVRVLNVKDNIWRDIQDSPVVHSHRPKEFEFVHFSGSVNWLVVCNYVGYTYDHYKNTSIEQFAIISLDLCTETHSKMLPPHGFNEVPFVMPKLSVLNDCLCFSHDFKRTHFIIWQMTEFGVEESWTQFLKISYDNLQTNSHSNFVLYPLYLSKKDDTVILLMSFFPLYLSRKDGTTVLLLTNKGKKDERRAAILYNWRDNKGRRINKPLWFKYEIKDYVESLVSYC